MNVSSSTRIFLYAKADIYEDDEIQMSTALYWLGEFLHFAQDVMLPFTPRLIPAILPNLAHHVPMIQTQAIRTNQALFNVVQNIPAPRPTSEPGSSDKDKDKASISPGRANAPAVSPPPIAGSSVSPATSRQATMAKESEMSASDNVTPSAPAQVPPRQRATTVPMAGEMAPHAPPLDLDTTGQSQDSRSHSPTSTAASVAPMTSSQQILTSNAQGQGQVLTQSPTQTEQDPFDYRDTVNVLTIQFLSEHEETRVAALKWLIMLHQKVPKKVLKMTCKKYNLYLTFYTFLRSWLWMMAHFLLFLRLSPTLRTR